MQIGSLSEEDGKYLASFTVMDKLSVNQTHLRSFAHFPAQLKLVRLEAAENQLTGPELAHLAVYADCLQTLKLANNKIATLGDLEPLAKLTKLENLDLANNEVCKVENFDAHIWKLLPNLKVLSNFTRSGEECLSDSDEDEYGDYGEEGEAENVLFDDEEEAEYGGEEGELEMDEAAESDQEGGAEKRQKHEEI